MRFDCKKCKMLDTCEMPTELGFMNDGCRAFTAKKPITNYDLLISKTPEEMAEFCAGIQIKILRQIEKITTITCNFDAKDLISEWNIWLRSPAEVDET